VQGPKHLLESEDHWVTNIGAWYPGERVVLRGKDLHHDFNDVPWMALLLYAITGRVFDKKQALLFEGMWTLCASYPDPRLWNNRVAALAGTTRSTGALAVGAATAVSEASIYGRRPDVQAFDFLVRTKAKLHNGADLRGLIAAEQQKYRIIPGFGRPVVRRDERIEPLMTMAGELGFSEGAYVKLAFEIEGILLKNRWRADMNIAVVAAALAADQGLFVNEYYQYTILAFSAGMIPCYLGALHKHQGTFFPLRCSRLKYKGRSRRAWSGLEESGER
jgi:citrate synthase